MTDTDDTTRARYDQLAEALLSAPDQPADGERSAPPTDLDWMEAVPDSLVDDLHSELGLLLNVDGHNDEAAEWLGDIVSTVTRLTGRELAERDNAIEDLRQDVGRLTRERNEWEEALLRREARR